MYLVNRYEQGRLKSYSRLISRTQEIRKLSYFCAENKSLFIFLR